MKKILALVLCALMLVAALPLSSFAAYENTHTNTGNQIEDLIAVATTQIGYTEGNSTSQQGGTSGGSGNYTKYGAWYGINPGAWCAMFVSWCANQAGISSSIITKHASCDLGMQWFQNNGVWQWSPACGGSYVPKRGDIIYFRTNTAQVTDSTHVGIVYASDSSYVYTIEGNASNKCQKKSYSLASAYILGYGTPAYTNTSYSTGVYTVTATELNMRAGAGTSYEVVTTLPNAAQVTVTQVSGTWGYTTYNGYSGWVSMKYLSLVSATTSYTLTFDPGDGTITSGSSTYSILYGQQYSAVMSAAPVATRNGYALSGWYCAAYGYTLSLADTFAATESVTFTAVWTPVYGIYETTASWLAMREGAGSSYTAITSLPNGTQVNITDIDGKWGYCTYDGYSGWISLNYCNYVGEAPTTYTLTLNPNGGTMPEGYSTTYEFSADELFVDVIGGYPVPTKDGYDFTGWRRSDWNSDFWTESWGTQPYTFGYDVTLNAEYVEASCEHNYVASVTTQATCTEDGVKTYTCSLCGESYTETISKTGHSYSTFVSNGDATCTADGTKTSACDNGCGSSITEADEGSATGHSFGEWYTTVEPAVGSEGESRRDCANCDVYETEVIPELEIEQGCEPELTVSGYKVMLSCADSINYVRYAVGNYTTSSEIKNASDCVTLNSTAVIKNTVSGICTLTMPSGGYYSVWVKTFDGTEYIFYADLTVMDQYITTHGVSITVNNLYGVKDFFIAPGDYDTYAEVKANYIVLVSSTKINGASDYTYIVPNEGMYTIYIRYEDTTRPASILKTTCTVNKPEFNGNGLQFTISNLDEDVKVVRTAYGEYSTPGEVKRAAGSRGFSGKTVLKNGTGEYTIQYRENGIVTIAVVYTHGYEVMYTYEVQKKVPSFVQNGNTVTFGQLDGLNLIRYAKGTYTTSSQIKAAAGSKVVKSDAIVDGFITVSLDAGTYTFCVQYADESYNYYVVTVE